MRVDTWRCAVGSALIAASLGWLVSEQFLGLFRWERRGDVQGVAGGPVHEPPLAFLLASRHRAETNNTALLMGIFGGVSGLALGVGGGLARRSTAAIITSSGLIGMFLGGLAGSAGPLSLVPLFYKYAGRPPSPALPLLVHTAMYAFIGGASGLAFGMGLSGPAGAGRGLSAGTMGATLGAIVYNLVHTVVFPLEWDLSPMPGRGATRLLAHFLVVLFAAACAVLATDKQVPLFRRSQQSDVQPKRVGLTE